MPGAKLTSPQIWRDSDLLYEHIYELHYCLSLDSVLVHGRGIGRGRTLRALGLLLDEGFAELDQRSDQDLVRLTSPPVARGWTTADA